ncbi:SDR family NAD(P)-dependent oxidoreductase [Nostoc sp. XA010]|nr:SDR family NAD(P)-dependent oxidoreductase [Nostoc sp. XA010]
MFQEAINCFGQLDILVNNAGIATMAPIAEVTEADYQSQT